MRINIGGAQINIHLGPFLFYNRKRMGGRLTSTQCQHICANSSQVFAQVGYVLKKHRVLPSVLVNLIGQHVPTVEIL
jgi:hypothetical protein